MAKILLFWLFLIGVTCQAQVKNFSIQVSGNFPLIKSVEQTDQVTNITPNSASGFTAILVNVGKVKESFSGKMGLEISGRFDYPVSERFFITSGLSISYLRFQRSVKIVGLTQPPNVAPVTSGAPFGAIIFGTPVHREPDGRLILNPNGSVPISRSKDLGSTTTMSVQIPLMLGTSFFSDKVQVRAGAIFSYLLRSTEVKEKFVAWTAPSTITEYKDESKEGFNTLQAGAMVQTTYLLGRHLGISFSAQKFFTPIYERAAEASPTAKYNILSLGLEYRL